MQHAKIMDLGFVKMASPFEEISCDDFLEFQDTLKKMRAIDDKIIYALNTTLPTDSFRAEKSASKECEHLYEQLVSSYSKREAVIKRCITHVSDRVRDLREERTKDDENIELLKRLRKEQTKLRLMQAEVNVEEVVKGRSLKVFYERCRSAYKPPNLNI